MSRQNILHEVSVMEKLAKLHSLPTLQNVIQGYYWRQNELKAGKGPNYNPTISEVASLLERDIRQTSIFANLENTLLSSRRIWEKIKTSIQLLSNLKAQPKARMSSPSYLKKLADFEKQCHEVFDICACKCKFLFDATVEEQNIPCTDHWRTKVICSCPISARIHPRELKFSLDQRSERRMRIGRVDVAASQDNMKRLHHNSSPKQARVEVALIENIDNLITSSENESSSQSPLDMLDG